MLFHMWHPDCPFCHRRQGNNFTPKKGVKAAKRSARRKEKRQWTKDWKSND